MKDVKPTFDDPKSAQAITYQDKFDKTMVQHNVNLLEVDTMLNEKQQSLKKKIFSLAKMEALVHPDPKLAAVYDEMAENGEEKYGYHYNETIMNIIFNEYILNDAKYLEKYKQAIPKKKKRRDKSGINALKKDAEDMEKRRAEYKKDRAPKQPVSEGSATYGSSGSFESPAGYKDDVYNVSKELDTEAELKDLMTVREAKPGQEKRAYGKHKPSGKNVSSAIAAPEVNKFVKQPFYKGGEITAPILNGLQVDKLKKPNKGELHENVEESNIDADEVMDESPITEQDKDIEESTSAGSAGGAAGYVGYAGPAAFSSKGDLSGDFKGKKKKKKVDPKAKPISVGFALAETNYLTDPSGFEKYSDMLNENMDPMEKITTPEQVKALGRKLTKDDIPNLAGQALHDLAIRIANKYLPISWDDLGDTNSMWDYIDENGGMTLEELKNAVKEAADDRIAEEGFDMNMLGEEQSTQIAGLDKAIAEIELTKGVSRQLLQKIAQENQIEMEEVLHAIVAGISKRQLSQGMHSVQGQPIPMNEKAKSKSQQQLMGMAYAYKKGEFDGEPSEEVKKIANGMSEKDLEDFASTKHDGLPDHVDENKLLDYLEQKAIEIYGARYNHLPDYQKDDLKAMIGTNGDGKRVNEDHLSSAEDKRDWIFKAQQAIEDWNGRDNSQYIRYDMNKYAEWLETHSDEAIDMLYDYMEKTLERLGIDPQSINENPMVAAAIGSAAGGFGKEIGSRVADKVGLEESHLTTRDEKIAFVVKAVEKLGNAPHIATRYAEMMQIADDAKIHDLYVKAEGLLREKGIDPETLGETMIKESHLETTEEQLNFIAKAQHALGYNTELSHQQIVDLYGEMRPIKIQNMYQVMEELVKEEGIEPKTLGETMIDNQEDSMKLGEPVGTQGGGDFPRGMQSTGPMGESKNINIMDENMKELEAINEDLEQLQKQHQELTEDRKPTTLVMKDRLGNENEKNFKDDLKHSGTKDIIDTTKELAGKDDSGNENSWTKQQTDVGKDPMKLGADIEKAELKANKGDALKNVGDSANYKGDEIPKRNLTTDEQDEVDLYRKNLGDFVFDNPEGEAFKERMKKDMGEKNYELREKRMKFNADAPMYNKDTQPMEDGIEKVQFDKAESKWNERMGIKENSMAGKYVDELGVTRFFDFNMVDVMEVKNSKKNAFFKADLNGLGNTYDSKVHMLESVEKAINEWDFFTDGNGGVFVEKKASTLLTETEHKEETGPVNEQFDKMKHLLGYDPKSFTNTKNIKL